MQSVLNVLFDSVFLVGGSYVGTGFVLGLVELWHKSHPDARRAAAEALAALPAAATPELPGSELGEKLELPSLEHQQQKEAIALEESTYEL